MICLSALTLPQYDFGHLWAHVNWLTVAVPVQVVKWVLGGHAPRSGFSVFGHGVTVYDLNFGGFTVIIVWWFPW